MDVKTLSEQLTGCVNALISKRMEEFIKLVIEEYGNEKSKEDIPKTIEAAFEMFNGMKKCPCKLEFVVKEKKEKKHAEKCTAKTAEGKPCRGLRKGDSMFCVVHGKEKKVSLNQVV